MNYSIIVLLLVFSIASDNPAQKFEYRSERVQFNIKIPPPDSVPPIVKLSLPAKVEGFPVYSRDTIFTLSGSVQDNSNRIYLAVNDKNKGMYSNGTFKIDIPVKYGENLLKLAAKDKAGNVIEKTITVFQDPNADIIPPIIKIVEPSVITERGIKVVKKWAAADSSFVLRAKIVDENALLGVWINDVKMDSLINDEIVFDLNLISLDTIVIKAADIFGNLSIETFSLMDVRSPEEDHIISGNYYALIIAINDYQSRRITSLEQPIKDAEDIIDVLIDRYTFERRNVTFLKNPTRREIISTLTEFRKKLKSEDNLFIYYAGHGYWDKEIEQGYWLPSDADDKDISNWISNSIIRDNIRGIKSKHTLLVSDACFSGGIFIPRDPFLNADASIIETYKYPSRKAITSGTLSTVPDQSVFAKFFIKRLIENNEKFLTTHRLFIALKEAVINNSVVKQTPVYGAIHGTNDEGIGDFIFIRK